jgi:prefoldin beta subunit
MESNIANSQDDFFNSLDEETQNSLQEIQILEHNFQQVLQQKQLFNMESSETDFALKEIEKAEGDLFKIVGGQVVIKTTKEFLVADLTKKRELIELRLKTINQQEKELAERIEELRSTIMSKISSKNMDNKKQ